VKTYRTKAPAKLNIRLKVTGRRADGYHELVSIMVPIDLFDLLELTVIAEGMKIEVQGFPVPTDESNLVSRAARSFFSKTCVEGGISVKLTKNIPVAAGMGGGSSDAAATLLCLNDIWSRPLSLSELHALAAGLGADVPFFLDCRPSLARGVGEILEPLQNWPDYWYVIVAPPIEVSTAWVYGNLKLKLTSGEHNYIVNALKDAHFAVSHILENDLEEVTSACFPIIKTIKKLLIDAGAEGAMMTGSGPSVFGVFTSRDQAVSTRQHLLSRGLGDIFMATNWQRR
jgi:4-diphosphocytidyl-2-C-methyl-D-erythritol kinase